MAGPELFRSITTVGTGAGVAVVAEKLARHKVTEFPVEIVTLDVAWVRRELRICVRSLDGLLVHAQQLPSYLGRHAHPRSEPVWPYHSGRQS